MIFKVTITKMNQAKRKSWKRMKLQKEDKSKLIF